MSGCAPGTDAPCLWLVRHGESTWNVLGLVQGHADGPTLTSEGRRQAAACAEALASARVGAVYSSDLERAAETAAPVAAALGLPVLPEPRLRERALGSAEGGPTADLAPAQSGIAGGRVVDADAAPPGGESVRELYERVAACVEELSRRHWDDGVVLVCHGGVVRAALAWLDGLGPDDMSWPEIANAEPIGRELAVPVAVLG